MSGQKLASLLVAAAAVGLLAISAGYLVGFSGEANSASPVPELGGASTGAERNRDGYKAGVTIGAAAQFQASLKRSYRQAFEDAFREAGRKPPPPPPLPSGDSQGGAAQP